ncbi:MAG TPA: hypothetical protein VG651_14195 [Stellaceae bacterium]|nr:hypothetical protein [Stellaceae bacterium]
MKRYLLAGLFMILGFIILGVATANLMSGPEKPAKPRLPAPAANDTHRPGGHGVGAQTNAVQPPQPPAKPTQPNADAAPTLLPGMPIPLSTSVSPPIVRPPTEAPPHVPIIQPTDLGTPSSPTAGRQHQ